MNLRVLCLLLLGMTYAGGAVAASPDDSVRKDATVVPLVNAHAHNDYEHARPLLDALDNGFCSVEADIHLVDGKLLVAHDRKDARPDRTLQSLYLEPLRATARKNRGRIYPDGPVSITLLIDVKTDAAPTYSALRQVLATYKDILTEFRADGTTPRAVTAILSGSRPAVAELSAESPRYAAYDGRLTDLGGGIPPSGMARVSKKRSSVSTWRGDKNVAISVDERKRVADTVAKAHQQGYRLRFWATPDTPAAWQLLRELGIDLINTDDLAGLRQFLRSGKNKP
ncbi:MAG: hypothetical protein H7145_10635 [Akkermansiaceae bacterium]|nr:hypothetical protein [Armatimonadota bacterium]